MLDKIIVRVDVEIVKARQDFVMCGKLRDPRINQIKSRVEIERARKSDSMMR